MVLQDDKFPWLGMAFWKLFCSGGNRYCGGSPDRLICFAILAIFPLNKSSRFARQVVFNFLKKLCCLKSWEMLPVLARQQYILMRIFGIYSKENIFLEKMRDVCKLWIAILQVFECLIPWRRVCYMLSYRLVYLGFHQNKCHTTPHHIKHKLYNFGYIKNNIGILQSITSKGNILRVWTETSCEKCNSKAFGKNRTKTFTYSQNIIIV